jgi:hypothetical protein
VGPVGPVPPLPLKSIVRDLLPDGSTAPVIAMYLPEMKFTVSKPFAVSANCPSTSQYLNVLFMVTFTVSAGP